MGERTLYEVMTDLVHYYDPQWIIPGRVAEAVFDRCLICQGRTYNGPCLEFFQGWDDAAMLARGEAVIIVCPSCWESCPFHGALSLVDGEGGELTMCDAGKLTEVRG